MKVLIINDFYPPEVMAGPEITARLILEKFRARSHVVEILTASLGMVETQDGIHRVLFPYNHPHRPIQRLSFLRKKTIDVDAFVKARRILKTFSPDVVLVQNLQFISFRPVTAALSTGIPVVHFAHGNWTAKRKVACMRSGLKGRIRGSVVYRGFSFDRIVCPSHDLLGEYRQAGFPESRLCVIPHGVDTELFTPSATSAPPDRFHMLYVGRVSKFKGIHAAITALKRLRDGRFGNAFLTIVGQAEAKYKAEIEETISGYGLQGHVRFAGSIAQSKLPRFYQAASVVVMPTLAETFGIVAIEAMACGRPLVASRVGGLQEIITHEEDGLLVPPSDCDALAKAIARILGNYGWAQEMGRAARKKVMENYSQERFVSQLDHVLRDAISK